VEVLPRVEEVPCMQVHTERAGGRDKGGLGLSLRGGGAHVEVLPRVEEVHAECPTLHEAPHP